MKIRTGFVSNSSSTSFSLEAIVEGFLPAYSKDLSKKFHDGFEGWHTNGAHSSHITAAFDITTDEGKEGFRYDLELMDCCVYTDNSPDEHHSIPYVEVLGIKLNVLLIDVSTTERYILPSHVADILKKIRRTYAVDDQYQIGPEPFPIELIYTQTPFNPVGDGWNGGDPMGQYAYTVDLRRCETKTGRITLTDNGQIEFRLQKSFAKKIGGLRDESEDIIHF